MHGYKGLSILLVVILFLIDIRVCYDFSPQPLSIVLDKRFYYILDTIKIRVYGPPGKILFIEIRNPQNSLVYWNQTSLPDQGYINLSITIREYWRYGRYTIYVSMPRGPKVTETFIVGKRIGSNIILYSTMNRTDIYNTNTFYIVLNPPINTSVLIKISNIFGEKIYVREISLENGFGIFSYRFNKSGVYFLNACWSGNEYYNASYNICRIYVASNRVNKYHLDYNIELSVKNVMVDKNITISVYPKTGLEENYLIIYNPLYRKIFHKIDSIIFYPNITGVWLCYIRSKDNLLRSRPKVFYVKEKVNMTLQLGQGVAYKRENIRIVAEIMAERCFGKVDLYLWSNDRWMYINSSEIYYNMANFYWKTSREGTYMFKAVWSGDSTHFASESNIFSLTVFARNLSVTFEIVDSRGRILYGSKIIIENKTYDTRQGRLSLVLKDDVYNISVIWKNVLIYRGYLNISREDTYRIKCRVYDLTVKLVGCIYNPIIDESVYIEGNDIKMTQISNKAGEVYFKQLPIGNYTLKTSIHEEKIFLDKNMVVELRYPPPWEEIKIALIIIIIIIAVLLILRRYVKIEIVIEKEKETSKENNSRSK